VLLLVVLPEKPVEGYLSAQDGEKQREDTVGEVVAPGGVDDEGARDGQGGDDKEEGRPEHHGAEGTPEDALPVA
jgi:hypothetical protein